MPPLNVQTVVRVFRPDNAPTFGQVLVLGLIASSVMAHFNATQYDKQVDELVEKGLVVDKKSGENLVSLCQDFEWTLAT